MTQRLPALALCLLPFAASAADEFIPIEQEPRHKLVFANKHVRYFDVELEPGYESRYHWHRNDGVFVNIASSPTIAEDAGKEPVRRGERAIGETYFIDYAARPKAHRVTNAGTTPYHVIDAEILSACGTAGVASEANQALLIDNERVLVTRIILHPGESTVLHPPCGILVSVSGGDIAFDGERAGMRPAAFKWRQQAGTTTLVNTGKLVFHGVDIRLK